MKPTSLADRLVNVQVQQPNNVSTYQQTRNQDIVKALSDSGFDNIMKPSDIELSYVNSVFQNKGFNEIDNVTFDVVDNIGKQEFNDLNNKLKQFTKSMGDVNTSGIFALIDDLSKDVQESDLEGIWNKAVNAKPSILARIIGLFNPHYVKKNVDAKLQDLQALLSGKGGALEVKLSQIERELSDQKNLQVKNIKTLESTFDIYYDSFMQLRKQFALVVYLEHSYKNQLELFKETNKETLSDLTINKKMQDYERVFDDIQNKRLILHKALLQLPITAQQNNNLVGVCKNLMKEIDNTIVSSFPSIRSNLISVGISIMTQKALMSNDSTQNLDKNLALLSSKVSADLAVKGELLSSQARLREANTIQTLVSDLKDLQGRLNTAKVQSKQNIDSATAILTNATNDIKQILGGTN